MKMTTEQFLSHLGIEVGKPFMCDGEKVRVKEYENELAVWLYSGDLLGWVGDIRYLLDKEITPLPKYTLTEDEKAIVRKMSYKIDFLGKDGVNLYGQIEGREPFWLPFNNVFNFIGQGIKGEVSLDELRKCL